jgi:hypothetical protein
VVAGNLETVKTVSDVAANVATIAALLVGAFWAYWAFVRERTRWPRAEVSLLISDRDLTEEQALLQVKVLVHNLGGLRITARELRLDVHQVLPLAEGVLGKVERDELVPEKETEAEWPLLSNGFRVLEWGGEGQGRCPEIEPGESEEFCFDLVVPRSIETVHVYAYLRNAKRRRRRELGWSATAFHELLGKTEARVENDREPKTAIRSRSVPAAAAPRAQKEPRPRPSDRPEPGAQGEEGSSQR